ncbi:MAG: S9 family peptidase [Alphaproteobacteria bacterium]
MIKTHVARRAALRVLVTASTAALLWSAPIHAHADGHAGPHLTVERIHADPALTGPRLRAPKISPDGSRVTILRGREDDARQLDLWSYDLATGKSAVLVSSTDLLGEPVDLSEEEKNRRERQRIYESGIVAYNWDKAGKALLFPLGGDVFLYDLKAKTARRLTTSDGFETDPKVSPQGGFVSYVRDNELFVYELASGWETQLTTDANGTVRNAVAEFVAQEELDRDTGYWWSPDDRLVAFTQIDESPVAIAERLDFGAAGAKTIRQRYPFAGTDNVTIRLGVVPSAGGEPRWIDLGEDADIYLANVHWAADGKSLYIARLSRDQKRLDLLKADPETGESRIILTQTSKTWINLNDSFRALKDGTFLVGSERNGFQHLYRYGPDGAPLGALTQGKWPILEVDCVDEANGLVYFTGWQTSALDTHLFKVPLAGGPVEQITTRPGRHGATFAEDCSAYIGTYTNPNQPLQAAAYTPAGERVIWLNENRLGKDHPYGPYLKSHVTPRFGTLPAADGTPLDYRLLTPADLKPGERRPAIVLVYGGPHAQRVSRSWGGAFEQLLVDEGYVVFKLDNRGAGNRGKAFEDPLYRAMGQPEVEDQAIGARWLAGQPFVDPDRIGVYGWSYGGYMTLMMLSQTPDLFAAGISGAPVTEWRLYDTAYTERYMGDPDPERDGSAYDASSVFAYLDGLKGEGELLLIHGMADDNVVFLNSIRLMDALQKAGKRFELMTYPGEKHGFRARENRLHRDRLILDFFARKLKTARDDE